MELGSHLEDLVIVLGVAAVTTVLFHMLRQPVVLGYILAGLIIGPYLPVPLVANVKLVSTLSELGVILLMFSIGLEFSIRRIAKVGITAAGTAVLEVGLMLSLGYVAGQLLGWTSRESLFAGACLSISSTMLVAKALEGRGLKGAFIDIVYSVLVFEDLLAVLLLAVLTAVASGHGLSPSELALTVGRLAAVLAAFLVGGLLVVPRFIRLVAKVDRPEVLLIATMSVCFGMALLAEKAGYSVALGAFLAGMLVSESGLGASVEQLIRPFRDVFAAVFFVSVGMTIDPAQMAHHWLPILVLSLVVIGGKLVGVTLGAFLAGNPLRASVRAGMTLTQIGEFSFIIAGLGIASGATGSFLLPVAVAVSCLTAFTTPLFIRWSERAAGFVDSRLPRGLQTFVTFYGSWITRLRAAPRRATFGSRLRRPVSVLILEAVLLAAIVVAQSIAERRGAVEALSEATGLAQSVVRWGMIGGTVALAVLFLVGIVRAALRVARILASVVLPPGAKGEVDLGTAPRRALVMTLHLAIVLAVGLPLLAILQPFVRASLFVMVVLIGAIGIAVWRSISNLGEHVRAGSEVIVEALAKQSRAPTMPGLDKEVRSLLPGFPEVTPVRLDPGSRAIGLTLAQIDLRARTGATVLAITRGEHGTVLPSAGEVLREGDVLALAGPEDAIDAARRELVRVGEPLPPSLVNPDQMP